MKNSILTIIALLWLGSMVAQNATIEGYAFETGNRGYLREVKITVYNSINAIKAELVTNKEGFFTVSLPLGENYRFKATKDIFEPKEATIKASELSADKTTYLKMEMKRKPGYLFDVTLAESLRSSDGGKMAIDSATIEIFNNTTKTEELVLTKHPDPNFQFTFEQGNHYTVMIRKDGYFTKRMEARVNVAGCILCFEGMGKVEPNISDNLTEGHTMGSLLANVEMDKVNLDRSMKIENIYYDYGKWDIRPDAQVELDKVIAMLRDNPTFIVEIGSHTDSRGQDAFNMELSKKRAKSAIVYVIKQGGIPPERITAQGYGETQLTNKCSNGVKCSDKQHEANRRTEIKVIGFNKKKEDTRSLRQIILDESVENFNWDDTQVIQIGEDGEIPDEIKEDLANKNKKPITSQNVMPTIEEHSGVPDTTDKQEHTSTTIENTETKTETTTTNHSTTNKIKPTPSGAFGEEIVDEIVEEKPAVEEVKPPKKSIADNYVPKVGPKMLANDYTGYMVEFFNSAIELPADHSIFKQFGQVKMENKSNGENAYLLGGFKSDKEASSYLEKIILPRFPTAKVVQYDAGKRVN